MRWPNPFPITLCQSRVLEVVVTAPYPPHSSWVSSNCSSPELGGNVIRRGHPILLKYEHSICRGTALDSRHSGPRLRCGLLRNSWMET